MSPIWAMIAGGGTAGHVVPGLAVANALVARGHAPETIHWVGSERGSEGRMVAEAGFEATLLPGRGIQRRLTAENVGAVVGLARACTRSWLSWGFTTARPRPWSISWPGNPPCCPPLSTPSVS